MFPQDVMKEIYQNIKDINIKDISLINKETYKDLSKRDFWINYCNKNNIILINKDINYNTSNQWYNEIENNKYVQKVIDYQEKLETNILCICVLTKRTNITGSHYCTICENKPDKTYDIKISIEYDNMIYYLYAVGMIEATKEVGKYMQSYGMDIENDTIEFKICYNKVILSMNGFMIYYKTFEEILYFKSILYMIIKEEQDIKKVIDKVVTI